jgi:pimeloyl-ACP methyl ester carboxylesterase
MVHGAFCGAWIWEPLAELLEARGHTVEALDLPGSGADRTAVAEVTLDAYAERVCEVLGANPEPAVLVPHSMGGMASTQAAARCPERVASMIYVASFLPQDGQSLIALTELPEGAGDQVQANMVVDGDPPLARMPGDSSTLALYGSCSPELAAWATARQKPQPVIPFTQPVAIPDGVFDDIPRKYVVCTLDRAIPPVLQRLMLETAGVTEVVEIETDHSPQGSATAELAAALDRLAG